MALNTLNTGNGFLTFFNTVTPLLYITAETDSAADFDQVTLQKWRDGGFDVNFPLYGDGGASYTNALKNISRGLGVGDSFAVIAYGDAAAVALDVFRGGMARLVVLVSYYPITIPDPSATFPIGIKVLVHLAAGTVGVTRTHEVLGIQGKRRTTTGGCRRRRGRAGC